MSRGSRVRHRAVEAICALQIMVGASWPAAADDARHLTTILLVARADLPDPDFADSVVLVMNHLADAPIGVIVNRPTPMTVGELFPEVKRLARIRDHVYFGGPVGLETVWFLFRSDTEPAHAVQAFDDVYLSGDRDLLLTLLRREKPMDGLKIYVGHSGWAPGQLEAEITRGDWTAGRAEPGAVFKPGAEHPWPPIQEPAVGT